MKKKRVSSYYRRSVLVDDDYNKELAARVDELEKIVAWIKKKLARRKGTGLTPKKNVFCSVKTLKKKKKKSASAPEEDAFSDENNQETGDGPTDSSSTDSGEDDREPRGDGWEAKDSLPSESENESLEEDGKETPAGNSKEESGAKEQEEEVDGRATEENESEAMDVEVDDSSSQEPPSVLVTLKEGDGVPMQWVEEGDEDIQTGPEQDLTEPDIQDMIKKLTKPEVTQKVPMPIVFKGPMTRQRAKTLQHKFNESMILAFDHFQVNPTEVKATDGQYVQETSLKSVGSSEKIKPTSEDFWPFIPEKTHNNVLVISIDDQHA